MRAALTGKGSCECCRLLVLARADVRTRGPDGKTALDMGDKDVSRAIREARDERAAILHAVNAATGEQDAEQTQVQASVKRAAKPLQAQGARALASALASSGKGQGKGYRKRGR